MFTINMLIGDEKKIERKSEIFIIKKDAYGDVTEEKNK